jgi:hypothetical protein
MMEILIASEQFQIKEKGSGINTKTCGEILKRRYL